MPGSYPISGFFARPKPPPAPIPLGVSTLGSIIPVSAGQRALIGMPIWCSEFRRVDLPTSQRYWRNATGGSVGLPGQVTTTIGCDFALAFGYPLISGAIVFVGRIWIDNGEGFALAYDAITHTIPSADTGINFTLYQGAPVQAQDAIILASEGDLTPGFNNLIYMVFRDFPSGAVKLPTIKVEFFGSDDILDIYTAWSTLSGSSQINNFATFYDPLTNEYWGWSGTATSTPRIHRFDAEDGTEEETRTFSVDASSNGLNNEFALYDPIERIVFTTESPATNAVPLVMIDVDGGGIAARFGTHNVSTISDEDSLAYPTHGAIAKYTGPGPSTLIPMLLLGTFVENEIVSFEYSGGSITFHEAQDIAAGGTGQIKTIVAVPIWRVDGFTDKLKASGSVQQDCTFLVGLNDELRQYDFGTRSDGLEQIGSAILETYGTGNNIVGIIPDVNARKVVIITRNASDSFAVARVYGLSLAASWQVIYARHYHGLFPVLLEYAATISGMSASPLQQHAGDAAPLKTFNIPPPDTSGNRFENTLRYSPLFGSKIAYQSGATLTLMDYAAGTAALRPVTEAGNIQEYVFDARSNSLIVSGSSAGGIDTGRIRLDVPGPSGLTIGTVLNGLALLAGYEQSEIFVDPQLTDAVLGVLLIKTWPKNELFNDLGKLYDFQTFESEGKIKFIRAPKGDEAHTVESLTVDTMAPIGEGEADDTETLITAIDEPANIPGGYDVIYFNPDKEYEISTAQFLVNNSIIPNNSTDIDQVEIPLVMTTAEAYQRASRLGLGASELSVTQQFRLPWKFSVIEPTDVVDITINNFRYVVQITEVTFNGDFSLSCFGRNYGFRDDIVVNSDGDLGIIPQPVPGTSISKPILLDMPYILASDDAGQVPTAYGAVTSYGQATWDGATFIRNGIGEFFSPFETVTAATLATLLDTDTPFQTDYETELQIILRTGSTDLWASTDRDGLLSGLNAIVVGKPGRWELIYFQDVTVIDDRNITLSTLLRGRRGTEVNTGNHQTRDDVYLVSSVATDFQFQRFLMAYNENDIGNTFRYKANEGGLEITEIYRMNSLRPFAVAYLRAELLSGDDVLISWFRRTRIETNFDEMVGFPVDPPLAEQSEEYEIEIYKGTVLKRTLTAATNSVTYTVAQQTADGFVPPIDETEDEVTFKVYQISAVAGRGFEAEKTYASI